MAHNLNFGEVEVTPLPAPAQWRTRQVVLQRDTGQTTPEGDVVYVDEFMTLLELFTVQGVTVTFWKTDDLVPCANSILRLAKLNKKGIRDRDIDQTPSGTQS